MSERDGGSRGSPVVLSLVVPVFDEQENLAPFIEEIDGLRSKLPPLELVLVDDGSRDESWARIRAEAGRRDWIRALRFLGNQGQTAAMAAGIDASRGELIAFLDADLQNDPADLVRLVEPVLAGGADVACGWRRNRKDRALSRTLPSMAANVLIARALGLGLHDVGCTLKVFRRIFLEDVQLFGEMHRFLPAYAQAQGARIVEMVVNHRPRHAGASKYGLSRVYKVLIDLLTVKMLNTYGSKPAYFFGKIAIALFALGSVAFSVVAWRTFVLDRPQSTPMIFVMLLCYVASLVCLTSGLLAEINIRILHKVGGKKPYKVVERAGFGVDAPAGAPAGNR